MVKVSAHKIVFKGKVKGAPKYADKVVKIERRVGKGGTFRAVTPKTNNYRKSYSDVWYTYTI